MNFFYGDIVHAEASA